MSAFPLRGFVRDDETIWIANLGLLGKMVGAAAVLGSKFTMEENGKITVETSLKALGVLGKSCSSYCNTLSQHRHSYCPLPCIC